MDISFAFALRSQVTKEYKIFTRHPSITRLVQHGCQWGRTMWAKFPDFNTMRTRSYGLGQEHSWLFRAPRITPTWMCQSVAKAGRIFGTKGDIFSKLVYKPTCLKVQTSIQGQDAHSNEDFPGFLRAQLTVVYLDTNIYQQFRLPPREEISVSNVFQLQVLSAMPLFGPWCPWRLSAAWAEVIQLKTPHFHLIVGNCNISTQVGLFTGNLWMIYFCKNQNIIPNLWPILGDLCLR